MNTTGSSIKSNSSASSYKRASSMQDVDKSQKKSENMGISAPKTKVKETRPLKKINDSGSNSGSTSTNKANLAPTNKITQ